MPYYKINKFCMPETIALTSNEKFINIESYKYQENIISSKCNRNLITEYKSLKKNKEICKSCSQK